MDKVEGVESDALEDSKVVSGMSGTGTHLVISEGDTLVPMTVASRPATSLRQLDSIPGSKHAKVIHQ